MTSNFQDQATVTQKQWQFQVLVQIQDFGQMNLDSFDGDVLMWPFQRSRTDASSLPQQLSWPPLQRP